MCLVGVVQARLERLTLGLFGVVPIDHGQRSGQTFLLEGVRLSRKPQFVFVGLPVPSSTTAQAEPEQQRDSRQAPVQQAHWSTFNAHSYSS